MGPRVIGDLVIIGATCDPTAHYLLLPAGLAVLGVGRRARDSEGFRRHVGEWLSRHTPQVDPAARAAPVGR